MDRLAAPPGPSPSSKTAPASIGLPEAARPSHSSPYDCDRCQLQAEEKEAGRGARLCSPRPMPHGGPNCGGLRAPALCMSRNSGFAAHQPVKEIGGRPCAAWPLPPPQVAGRGRWRAFGMPKGCKREGAKAGKAERHNESSQETVSAVDVWNNMRGSAGAQYKYQTAGVHSWRGRALAARQHAAQVGPARRPLPPASGKMEGNMEPTARLRARATSSIMLGWPNRRPIFMAASSPSGVDSLRGKGKSAGLQLLVVEARHASSSTWTRPCMRQQRCAWGPHKIGRAHV